MSEESREHILGHPGRPAAAAAAPPVAGSAHGATAPASAPAPAQCTAQASTGWRCELAVGHAGLHTAGRGGAVAWISCPAIPDVPAPAPALPPPLLVPRNPWACEDDDAPAPRLTTLAPTVSVVSGGVVLTAPRSPNGWWLSPADAAHVSRELVRAAMSIAGTVEGPMPEYPGSPVGSPPPAPPPPAPGPGPVPANPLSDATTAPHAIDPAALFGMALAPIPDSTTAAVVVAGDVAEGLALAAQINQQWEELPGHIAAELATAMDEPGALDAIIEQAVISCRNVANDQMLGLARLAPGGRAVAARAAAASVEWEPLPPPCGAPCMAEGHNVGDPPRRSACARPVGHEGAHNSMWFCVTRTAERAS